MTCGWQQFPKGISDVKILVHKQEFIFLLTEPTVHSGSRRLS
jgi:hypothetical protein